MGAYRHRSKFRPWTNAPNVENVQVSHLEEKRRVLLCQDIYPSLRFYPTGQYGIGAALVAEFVCKHANSQQALGENGAIKRSIHRPPHVLWQPHLHCPKQKH